MATGFTGHVCCIARCVGDRTLVEPTENSTQQHRTGAAASARVIVQKSNPIAGPVSNNGAVGASEVG